MQKFQPLEIGAETGGDHAIVFDTVTRHRLLHERLGQHEALGRRLHHYVFEFGMHRDRLIRGQRPRRGGPAHDRHRAVARMLRHVVAAREQSLLLGHGETHVDRGRGLVFVFDLGLGERRAAVGAPVHGLAALVHVTVFDDAAQRTDDVGLKLEIHREIGALPIAPHAEAEVEYEDKTSPAIDVRFAVAEEQALFTRCHYVPEHPGHGPVSIVIWTTTPWTLPANQAVAVHPELEYVVVQTPTERLVLAEALMKQAMVRYDVEDYRVIATCLGADLEGLKLLHPFYAREVPVIIGDHVTTDAGTGAVHTAPGHGQEDYVVGLRYGLPVENPVGNDGVFLPGAELFAGEHVFKANDHVIEVLKAMGALVHHEALRHSYPHCWRHKTPIFFRATPQWFIRMDAAYPGAVGNERQGISMEQSGLRAQALCSML